MPNAFQQIEWDEALLRDAQELVRLALCEDWGEVGDLTSQAVIGAPSRGKASIVAREAGVLAGVAIPPLVIEQAKVDLIWSPTLSDGDTLQPGTVVGTLEGAARDLLGAERTILNFMSRLCGVATLTAHFVEEIVDVATKVYDTRKTTPGWRRIEKYAVRCGGGSNHRLGLGDAVMIKDNHLALSDAEGLTPAAAVLQAREFAANRVIEVEVDTLEQFHSVLGAKPDVVLLDNMSLQQLREAVAHRDQHSPGVVLEASGGVRIETIGAIAATGVDRISVGALTHSARALDLGLDWR